MFRQEAIDHQRLRFHGSIVLARTWSYTALTILLTGGVLLLMAFALVAGYARKESVAGVLVPAGGLAQVSAPVAGVVSGLHIVEGQQVKRGESLLVISSERVAKSGQSDQDIQTSLRSRAASLGEEMDRRGKQANAKRGELTQRAQSVRMSIEQRQIEIRLEAEHLNALKEIARRYPDLVSTGAVSVVEAIEKQSAITAQEARIAAARNTLLVSERELKEIENQLSELPLQLERESAQLQRAVSEIDQQITEAELRRAWQVRADREGVVGAVRVTEGQSVALGQPMLDLMPASAGLVAELFVPTRAIGFVKVGTPVQVRFDAFPFQKFGQFPGRVSEVSSSAASPAELRTFGLQAGQISEPVYRVRVDLQAQEINAYGAHHTLKAGMQLSASLVLERRTLAEWALLPLYTLTGRL